ncbi:uncharacterized protein LOC135485594 [Lineus longissimus]|uniref:uncharacterized protein LOC135485594 n=1 Tax=Lineus longissimus TaxID=88925 RepID=UPI002B4CD0D0
MSWLQKVLEEHSTKRYYVEYRRYLSNHISHGIVALERLGATEDRTRQWIKWYAEAKLAEKPREDDHVDDDPITPEELDDVTGKRGRFYSILNYYAKKLEDCKGDVDTLVRNEFPQLSNGLQATLLHSMIQLGYGYEAKQPRIILEGVAYLRHSYIPIVFDKNAPANDINKFGKGNTDIVDVLKALKRDDELFEHMEKRSIELEAGWVSSKPQYQIRALTEKGDKLIGYANQIKVPSDRLSDPVRVADWLLDQIITVFTMAEDERRNDFVLLHGVTCTWSVRQIVPLLDVTDALEAIRSMVCVLFSAYICTGGANLTNPVDTSIKVDAAAWEELIKRAIVPDVERDEHVYKLIQVCHEQWKKRGNEQNSALYFTASKICLENPFPPFKPSKPRL